MNAGLGTIGMVGGAAFTVGLHFASGYNSYSEAVTPPPRAVILGVGGGVAAVGATMGYVALKSAPTVAGKAGVAAAFLGAASALAAAVLRRD